MIFYDLTYPLITQELLAACTRNFAVLYETVLRGDRVNFKSMKRTV